MSGKHKCAHPGKARAPAKAKVRKIRKRFPARGVAVVIPLSLLAPGHHGALQHHAGRVQIHPAHLHKCPLPPTSIHLLHSSFRSSPTPPLPLPLARLVVSATPSSSSLRPSENRRRRRRRSISGNRKGYLLMSTVGNSTNIFWHECPVGKHERQKLLNQKGCVVWITGLSGSGKSTLACSISRELYSRGKLSYVLDGDNLRHGLNKNLGFKAEDRAENIRRVGEVAKLFADAGLVCIASLISPYRKDRDACRAMLPDESFIEVFMNMPLALCEARDAKGLYKLARAGKIKGFTGIDDPYEPPLKCEIELSQRDGICPTPGAMAGKVVSYLDEKGFLETK